MKRIIRNILFRLKHGYSRSDLYNIDYSLAKWIIPRLKEFKNVKKGIPVSVYVDSLGREKGMDIATKEWEEVLDKIILAFEIIIDESDGSGIITDFDNLNIGLDLFRKHLCDLWW